MGNKIKFMAVSCQNIGLFQSFMAYYKNKDEKKKKKRIIFVRIMNKKEFISQCMQINR